MKLYLVRHGITDWNARKKIQGQVDIPLNETGRDLARKTAEGLKDVPFDLCMTSPLCRAKETARIILGSRNVNILTSRGSWRWHLAITKGNAVPGKDGTAGGIS